MKAESNFPPKSSSKIWYLKSKYDTWKWNLSLFHNNINFELSRNWISTSMQAAPRSHLALFSFFLFQLHTPSSLNYVLLKQHIAFESITQWETAIWEQTQQDVFFCTTLHFCYLKRSSYSLHSLFVWIMEQYATGAIARYYPMHFQQDLPD